MGRSRKVTGPYLDNMGIDMIEGGGKLFAASRGRHIGPGHFGRLELGDGVEKFSLHYEADLDRGGVSVLDIRPLLWRDGWPVAGDNLSAGIYRIESARTGTVLELAVQGFPVGGFRQRRGGPPGSGIAGSSPPPGGPPPEPQIGLPIEDQEPAHVAASWPATPGVRLAPAMLQAQQKWVIAPAPNGGGYPGAPYYRITVAGTERSLTATAGAELAALPFTGAPEQLWRIDQLTEGAHRIAPKAVPGIAEPMALSAVGSSMPTLSKFDPSSDRQRWLLGAP
jgi:arabinan endo-1,5-alpha-L-arabinosidase